MASFRGYLTSPGIAEYARIYDESATIVQGQGGGLYVLYDDDRIEPFEVEMVPFTVVLGDVAVAETQAMWDRIAGGPVGICLSRKMEVA